MNHKTFGNMIHPIEGALPNDQQIFIICVDV